MDANRWRQVDGILQSLLTLPFEKQEQLLPSACAGDLELEREVRSLLTSHRRVGNFLESPALEVAARAIGLEEARDSRDSLPGQIVSHYRVLQRLGSGGMGVVYKAEDILLGRMVALKFLPEGMAQEPAVLDRFRREARAASALNHPSICTIYEIGEHLGRAFISMEFLDGLTLRQRIGGQPLPYGEMISLGIEIAEALESAHAEGIIHRDIKPANIFVTIRGHAKVLDFGLAKLAGARYATTTGGISGTEKALTAESLTGQGARLGTVAYMSPEQACAKTLDHRTDLFSFGAVLYEMATGMQPFRGESEGVIYDAILNREPVAPVALNPKIPAQLADIIYRTLEKDRELRYKHAAEIRADLQELERAPDAPPVSWSASPSRREQSRVGLSILGKTIAALLLLALALAVAVRYWEHPTTLLTDSDTIVLADFTNTTGDSIFDETLKQALFVQLSQSPFLNVLPENKVSEALKFIGMESAARLSQKTTLEICKRTNSKVMIAGSVSHSGNRYEIVLKAVACASGEVVEQDQAESVARGSVLQALDRASTSMRAKLGESINTIQKYDVSVAQATTPSLQALQSFSEAVKVHREKGDMEALPLLKHAVELDPNFALAYTNLGIIYSNQEEQGLAKQNYQKAFELRNRASDREAYHIAADYYDSVTGELDKADEVYEAWVKAYPRDSVPVGNLATNYAWEGKTEKSLTTNIQALRLDPDDGLTYSNLVGDYATLNRLDEAKSTYERALANQHAVPYLHLNRYAVAFLEDDEAEMGRQLAWASGQPDVEDALLSFQSDTEAYFGHLNKAREFSQRAAAAAERNDRKETAAIWLLDAALREAEVGNSAKAQKLIVFALGLAENRDLKILAALAYARSGDAIRATRLIEDFTHSSPLHSVLNGYWLPTIRGAIELDKKQPQRSTEILQAASAYEFGSPPPQATSGGTLYPVYLGGEAYLRQGRVQQAAAEFEKMIGNRCIVQNGILGALAHLQLGRAEAEAGSIDEARRAYQDFLALWKDADPDVPILKQAKAEYAKLK
jgi:serine/threonine protein kinase/Tfp pilus assembly protein PilF